MKEEFKGNEFFEERISKLCAVTEGMEVVDALTLLTSFSILTIEASVKKDLEVARSLLNTIKTSTLDHLSAHGWE